MGHICFWNISCLLQVSPLGKGRGPSFEQTYIHPRMLWLKVISLFHYYLPLEKSRAFIWRKLNPIYPMMLCIKFGWNWPCVSGEEDFLNFVSNFHYFVNYLPLEKGVILYHAPRKQSLGGIWFLSVCLFVCLSVSVRPSVLLCLSVPCLWIIFCPLIFWKMGEWIFLKICTLINHHLKMCTWIFQIDWIIFIYFTGFFLFWGHF